MTKQTALDFADLRYLEITCADCGTRAAIDITQRNSRAPAVCLGCGSKFDAIQNPVNAFFAVYRGLAHSELKHRFRIITEDNDTIPRKPSVAGREEK
jgi:transcription elongation factor Elf1